MDYVKEIEEGIRHLITLYPVSHRGEIHVSPDVYNELFFWAQEHCDGKMNGKLNSVVFQNVKFDVVVHDDKIDFYDVEVKVYED